MNVDSKTPLILETAASHISSFFRKYRPAFLSSLILGFLAYGFAFTNKLINHDEAQSLFTKGATVISGRWGLGALDAIFPNYSMPWIYGLITIFLIGASVCLLVSLFSIKSSLLQVLLAGTVTVFPSVIGLFGYMFTSSSFALSFFLSVLTVVILQGHKKWYFLPAGACLVLSLSIYQAYISVAASLLVLVLIQHLLTGSKPLDILNQGIFYVAFLVAALVVYWIGTQVVLKLTNTDLGIYASNNFTFTPAGILSGAVLAYQSFFRFFTEGFCGLIPTAFARTLHIILFLFIMIALCQQCWRKKYAIGSLALLAMLVLVLPLAINCMYMITAAESIHTLVLYSFISFYVFTLMLLDLLMKGAPLTLTKCTQANILTVILALIITINTFVANQSYLQLHLRYENAYAFYTALAADIRMQPQFTEQTKLAVIGTYQQPDFYNQHFEHIHSITGITGFLPDSYSNQDFLTYYVGFPIPFASPEEQIAIQQTIEYAQMPVYPYYGSMIWFDNILVVKLS